MELVQLELNNNELDFRGVTLYDLTELQVKKMFMLLQNVEGFKFGELETVIEIEFDENNFKISSSPFEVWGGEDNEEDDVWGDGVSFEGTFTDLNRMNTYENRLYDSEELDRNPMSISFEYEVKDGKIQDFDEDSHYGSQILSDEETSKIVEKLKSEGHISDNENGMIDVYDDMIVIEVVGKDPLLISL